MTADRKRGEIGVQTTNGDFSSESETMSKSESTTTATEPATDCTECAGVTRRTFIKGASAGAAIAATGAGNALAQDTTTEEAPEFVSGRDLNWDTEYTQNPYYAAVLTKAKHRVKWGTDDMALRHYENDSGEKDTLGGRVDREDSENVITARADKIAFPDADAFPRGATYDHDSDADTEEEPVSALDPTHWSTTDATNGTISVSDPGRDVHSLNISTSSVASGETVSATFDLSAFNAEIDSDEAKRFLQLVANVNSLASAASVTVAVEDADGDRKEVYADSSKDGGSADVFATGTVNGAALQQRLGDLTTVANGDGNYSTLTKLVVEVSEANADLTFSALNVEKMSRWTYGSYLKNEDTDDEERTKRYEPSGEFTVTDLDTFSSAFHEDGAVFYDLQYPMRVTLERGDLDHEYRFVEAEDRPGYEWVLEQRGKVTLTTGYDLSWASPVLSDDVGIPASRFTLVQTASGTEDVEFSDIDDSSWTEHTGNYDSQGVTVALSDPAQTGVVVAYESHVLLTSSNREAVEDVPTTTTSTSGEGGSGTGRGRGSDDGGIVGWLMAGVTAMAAFVTGLAKGWW